MTNANAAWSTTTKATAAFWCVSNCEAGEVGGVAPYDLVIPSTDRSLAHRIGAWPRTVLIQCKTESFNGHRVYHVTVQDKNWKGIWWLPKDQLSQAINDTNIPVC